MFLPDNINIMVVGGGTVSQYGFVNNLGWILGYGTILIDPWR